MNEFQFQSGYNHFYSIDGSFVVFVSLCFLYILVTVGFVGERFSLYFHFRISRTQNAHARTQAGCAKAELWCKQS